MDSVMKQSLKEIEIICVDAGSTDGTLKIINECAEKDERIRIIHSKRRSYGFQVNTGIASAKGEYIGIVETDDLAGPNMFKDLYEYAVLLNADVVKEPYIEYRSFSSWQECYFSEILNRRLPKEKCFSVKEYGDLLAYHASVWAGIYKKEYLVNNDIRFVEADGAGYVDVGFRISSLMNTDRIAWYPKAEYYYRTDNSDSSTNSFNLTTMIKRWKEVHDFFADMQDEYDRYYGPYLIFDEYLNTISYLGNVPCTEDDLNAMICNMSYVKKETIESSPVISDRIKKRLLSFKDDPAAYFKKRQRLYHPKRIIRFVGNRMFPKGSGVRKAIKKYMFARNLENGK